MCSHDPGCSLSQQGRRFGKGVVPISVCVGYLVGFWGNRLRGDAGDMVKKPVELQDWPNAITDGVATTPVSF